MMEKLVQGAEQLGLTLTARQVHQFQLYYQELVEWNKRINLTAITDYEEVQLKHFVDGLTLVPALRDAAGAKEGFTLLDIGTGAGIPGIPVKIHLPKIRLTLLDSIARKTAFLKYIVGRLGLDYVNVVTGRAEQIAHQPEYRGRFDVVVCRAVSKLSTVAELTLPFCREGGLAIAPKKGDIGEELEQAARAVSILGGVTRQTRRVDVELLEPRLLVIMEKVSPTPDKYPRRAGMPAKRPL